MSPSPNYLVTNSRMKHKLCDSSRASFSTNKTACHPCWLPPPLGPSQGRSAGQTRAASKALLLGPTLGPPALQLLINTNPAHGIQPLSKLHFYNISTYLELFSIPIVTTLLCQRFSAAFRRKNPMLSLHKTVNSEQVYNLGDKC